MGILPMKRGRGVHATFFLLEALRIQNPESETLGRGGGTGKDGAG